MKHRITITLQDDESFNNFMYQNDLIRNLYLSCQLTGKCLGDTSHFRIFAKKTKAGILINEYCKEGDNDGK